MSYAVPKNISIIQWCRALWLEETWQCPGVILYNNISFFSILGEKPATNKLPYFPMNISLTENSSLKSELFAQFLLDLRLLFKDSHKLY